ncbi:MAG TPA: glutamine synthetase family protein [Devosiaceae bacterium]
MLASPESKAKAVLEKFAAENPDLERIELLFPDMNGVFRGKWLPPDSITKLVDGVRLPISSYAVDIWGRDVEETGLALASGDPDGVGVPIISTLGMVPWSEHPTAHVLMTLETGEGEPCIYDPRQRLVAIVDRLKAMGLTAVVAAELEFYLFRPREDLGDAPEPPEGTTAGSQLYDLDAMDELEHVLRDIRNSCEELGVPAETVTAEIGPGQFEINLKHLPDPLAAADSAMLFKRAVWGSAAKHNLEATFMAKPYGAEAGSGMHVHVSLVDEDGNNIFDGGDAVNPALLFAIGGALETMRDFQAIFAPHFNSYRRFMPNSYAPTSPNWGIDNRNAAVRVPEFSGPGARMEHRISGSDVNPYLAIAAILGGMMYGLEKKIDPGPPVEEGGEPHRRLYRNWSRAVEGFARSSIVADIFGKEYRRVYSAVRRSEIREMADMVTDVEYRTYLSRI